jgi:hypothetical protein
MNRYLSVLPPAVPRAPMTGAQSRPALPTGDPDTGGLKGAEGFRVVNKGSGAR